MSGPKNIFVIWSSADRDVALKMVFMYTHNSMRLGWWDRVALIVWGPSSKLLAEDEELQSALKRMKEDGVELMACKACSDMYGVSARLEELGVDVKYMGEPLTKMLKEGWASLTF